MSCAQAPKYVERTYILPNNYAGYLVIEFDCVGGYPLEYEKGSVELRFTGEGTVCVSNSLITIYGPPNYIYESGEPVPMDPKDGFGYCCGYTLRMGDDRIFAIEWVGPIKDGLPVSTETVDEFLSREFGIPYNPAE